MNANKYGIETLPAAILELVRSAGGPDKVHPEELARHGYLCVSNPFEKRSWLVRKDEAEALQTRAAEVLEEGKGYLYAPNIARLEAMMRGEDHLFERELGMISGRTKKFVAAGIPPIFNPLFAGKVHRNDGVIEPFPTVDFIIQFGAGTYFSNMRRISDKKVKIPGGAKIPPATVDEVLEFRRQAFLGRKIDAAQARESALYVAEKFTFGEAGRRERALERDRLVFMYLEEMLEELPSSKEQFLAWKRPTRDVGHIRWYVEYAQEERERAIAEFLDSLPGKPTAPDRKILDRLSAIFPERLAGFQNELVMRHEEEAKARAEEIWHLIRVAAETRDFREIPEVAYVEEPWKTVLLPAMERFLKEECIRLGGENPEALFSAADDLDAYIAVPSRILLVPHFKEVIDEARLEAARELSDKTFLELFSGFGGRRAALGHKRAGGGHRPAGAQLSSYLCERYEELGRPGEG